MRVRKGPLRGLAVFLFVLAAYGLFREVPSQNVEAGGAVLARFVPVVLAVLLGLWAWRASNTR